MTEKTVSLAFDGIGGCGKTHVINEVYEHLENLGHKTLKAKVSGLGSSPRVQRLREIHNHRERFFREGSASPKQLIDKDLDRIHRLATRYQVRMLKREIEGNDYDYVLLDRTPMMLWAYSASRDALNPHLDKMLKDSTRQTLGLETDGIYFLEVDPMEVITRRIARDTSDYCSTVLSENVIRRFGINPQQANAIVNLAQERRASGNVKFQAMRECDYVPYDQLVREQNFFKTGFEQLRERGANIITIDANQSLAHVVDTIANSIASIF